MGFQPEIKLELSSLIESLVGEILSEVRPEAPKDSIGGEYLWGDPEDNIRRDKAEEPNTEEENLVLDKVRRWYGYGSSLHFLKAIPAIEKFIEDGYYAKYFLPPNQPVYRYISSIELGRAAKILGVSEEEIKANQDKVTVLEKGGALKPRNQVSSWTIDPTLEEITALAFPKAKAVSILAEANPVGSGNKFYMNPLEIYNTFEPEKYSEFLEMEYEVVAVGPVNFRRAAYYYGPDKGALKDRPNSPYLNAKKMQKVTKELSKALL